MGKVESLMGMSADELAVQREAQRLAEQQKQEGIQQGVQGLGVAAMGGISAGAKTDEGKKAFQDAGKAMAGIENKEEEENLGFN